MCCKPSYSLLVTTKESKTFASITTGTNERKDKRILIEYEQTFETNKTESYDYVK
jgi:hypothetical protein